MPTEEGVVEKIQNEKAFVRVQKSSACKNCSSRESCEINSSRDMLVEVINEAGAKQGDWVELSVPAGSFIRLSLLVYVVPVIALVAGALLGHEAGLAFDIPVAPASVIGGGLFVVLAYYLLRWLNNLSAGSLKYSPRMTRVIYRPQA
jgi:sigma-E factor negative regulatory protein RseC